MVTPEEPEATGAGEGKRVTDECTALAALALPRTWAFADTWWPGCVSAADEPHQSLEDGLCELEETGGVGGQMENHCSSLMVGQEEGVSFSRHESHSS